MLPDPLPNTIKPCLVHTAYQSDEQDQQAQAAAGLARGHGHAHKEPRLRYKDTGTSNAREPPPCPPPCASDNLLVASHSGEIFPVVSICIYLCILVNSRILRDYISGGS
jgi:hypothetical protein